MEAEGVEPSIYRMQNDRLNQLSYAPMYVLAPPLRGDKKRPKFAVPKGTGNVDCRFFEAAKSLLPFAAPSGWQIWQKLEVFSKGRFLLRRKKRQVSASQKKCQKEKSCCPKGRGRVTAMKNLHNR